MLKKTKLYLRNEKIRFLVIGGFNTIAGFLVFAGLQWAFGKYISYFGSLYLTHLLMSTLAFYLYRRYVFPVKGHLIRDFFRFQTVYIAPLLANTFLLPAIIIFSHVNVYVAQAISTLLLTVISFIGHKYFSFRRPKS